MAYDLMQNDTGTEFILVVQEDGVAVDISEQEDMKIYLKKSSVVKEKAATLHTDGTDGKMKFVTEATDFDQKGRWQVQGYVKLPSWEGRTDIVIVEVGSNLS